MTLSLVLPKTGCAKVSVGAPNPCDNAALQAEVVRILETERRALRVGASFKASDVSTTLNSIPDAEGGGKTFAVTVAAEDEAAAEQILAALAKLMGTPDAAADNLQIVVDEVGAAPSVTTLVLLAPPSPPPAPRPPPAEEGEVNCSAPDTPANATGCEPDVTPEWLYQMAIETLSFGGFIGAAVGAGVLLLCICCCCVCLCRRKCCKKKGGAKMASAEYYTASSDLTKSKQGKNSLIAFDSIFSAGGGGGHKHGGGAAPPQYAEHMMGSAPPPPPPPDGFMGIAAPPPPPPDGFMGVAPPPPPPDGFGASCAAAAAGRRVWRRAAAAAARGRLRRPASAAAGVRLRRGGRVSAAAAGRAAAGTAGVRRLWRRRHRRLSAEDEPWDGRVSCACVSGGVSGTRGGLGVKWERALVSYLIG